MTIIWFMVPDIWSATDRIFCHSGPCFALLTPYEPTKSKFLKTEKKTPKDIVILQMRTKNNSHMMYGCWDMECNGQNFFVILDCFWPFTPLTTQKIKILEKWKKHLEILSFYTCVTKMTIIWCMVPDISSMTDRMFCHFESFFYTFTTPNNPKNQNFEKK